LQNLDTVFHLTLIEAFFFFLLSVVPEKIFKVHVKYCR